MRTENHFDLMRLRRDHSDGRFQMLAAPNGRTIPPRPLDSHRKPKTTETSKGQFPCQKHHQKLPVIVWKEP